MLSDRQTGNSETVIPTRQIRSCDINDAYDKRLLNSQGKRQCVIG